MKTFLTGYSKKLIAFLITVAVILLNDILGLGLSEEKLLLITGGFGAYAISQGMSDAGGKGRVQAEEKARAGERARVDRIDRQ